MATIQYKKFSADFKSCNQVKGIEIAEISAEYGSIIYPSFLFIEDTYGITTPSVVQIQGENYLAGSIFTKVTKTRLGFLRSHPSVKYGPGARRVYLRINEHLIDNIAQAGILFGNENYNQKIRKEQIADFADFLIEMV